LSPWSIRIDIDVHRWSTLSFHHEWFSSQARWIARKLIILPLGAARHQNRTLIARHCQSATSCWRFPTPTRTITEGILVAIALQREKSVASTGG
jgi:hypothetical protein